MRTLAEDIRRYSAPIALSRLVSRRTLSVLRIGFFILFSLCGLLSLGSYFIYPNQYFSLFLGGTLLGGALWLEQMLLYSYHNSFYFYGLNSLLGLRGRDIAGATYEVADTLYQKEEDVTLAFCASRFGGEVLLRAGLAPEAVDSFLRTKRMRITTNMIPLPPDQPFSLISLGSYILQQDSDFKNLLKAEGIPSEIFLGALRWVIGAYHQEKRVLRWWSKDNLSKTKGIGREWTYGNAPLLERYSRDPRSSTVFSNLTSFSPFAKEKIEEIEHSLARAKAANILLIGDAGVGKMDLLVEVQRRLDNGKAIDALSGQHMVLLDTTRLISQNNSKADLENTLLALFDEAREAGNLIVVIENLSSFIREAQALGVYLPELLDPFLATPALHIIGTDTPGAYHTFLEPLGAFTRRFSEVLIDAPDLSSTTRLLEGIALQNEMKYATLFTYAALEAITKAADRYLVEGVMPDKAIELLVDVATRASHGKIGIVTADFVYGVISDKTGIPTGPIEGEERDLLLQLESHLHERVIGQRAAIDAIARTMRRARAGIQASDKPIGSFLFLGPTGVGKTETAKALAALFFGSEANMHRFDMSEFSGADALARLIGDGEHSGLLADMLREHPYAVVLLDEFEKANRAVHDLFLQILDEGVFTDTRGDKVNARNTIIIATSNAGSQLILKTVAQRQALATLTEEIIAHIIAQGIFRPELINRFDSTIIFEPLTSEEQGQVAALLLKGLYTRIKERGYELVVTRDLMDVLVEKGYSPEFGARPMQRVLQDLIEEKVAEKIIAGSVAVGDTITLSKADFSAAELSL